MVTTLIEAVEASDNNSISGMLLATGEFGAVIKVISIISNCKSSFR
jgi:hypothetical protein